MEINDKKIDQLIDMIHFAEQIAERVHSAKSEKEVYSIINDEFVKSEKYDATIALLNESNQLIIETVSNISPEKLVIAEKLVGFKIKDFDLMRCETFRKVIKEGVTIYGESNKLLEGLFPSSVLITLLKLVNYEKKNSIIVPLYIRGEIAGCLGMTSPEITEKFIPTVEFLSKHISIVLDSIYERRKSEWIEKKLQVSEQNYRSIFNSSPDMIFRLSNENEILDCNKTVLTLLRRTKEEVIGEKFINICLPDSRSTVSKYLKLLHSKGEITGKEFEIFKGDGNSIIVEMNSSAIYDVDGKRTGSVVILRDITKHKEVETFITEQSRDLAEKNVALKEAMEQITIEKNELIDKIYTNFEKLIQPKFKKLKVKLSPSDRKKLEIIEKDLKSICSSFGKKISKKEVGLSPQEVEVADLIKNGLRNKEIAETLGLSVRTIETVRKNIRRKYNIINKPVNLRNFLQSL